MYMHTQAACHTAAGSLLCLTDYVRFSGWEVFRLLQKLQISQIHHCALPGESFWSYWLTKCAVLLTFMKHAHVCTHLHSHLACTFPPAKMRHHSLKSIMSTAMILGSLVQYLAPH